LIQKNLRLLSPLTNITPKKTLVLTTCVSKKAKIKSVSGFEATTKVSANTPQEMNILITNLNVPKEHTKVFNIENLQSPATRR